MDATPTRARIGKGRPYLLLGVAAFAGCFQLVYLNWLYPVFGYFGFGNNEPQFRYVLLAWTLSIVPGLWMPITLTRPSQLIYWVIYLAVFVPSMFVPIYASLSGPAAVVSMMLTMFAGFAIIGAIYRFPLRRFHPPRLSPRAFWGALTCLALGLVLWVIVVFHGKLHIVSFADVYDLRFAAEDVMEGNLVNYALMWLSAVVAPFFLAWATLNKRPLMFLAGALIQMLVYSAVGAKSVVASVIIIPLFYLFLRDRGASFGLKISWSTAAAFFLLYLGRSLGNGAENLFFWGLSLVFMRTFGLSGLMTEWYRDFFQRNPLTYYSHIKGVSWFVHYPYANPLGIEVGWFFWETPHWTPMRISGRPMGWLPSASPVSCWCRWCALWCSGCWIRSLKNTTCASPRWWCPSRRST